MQEGSYWEGQVGLVILLSAILMVNSVFKRIRLRFLFVSYEYCGQCPTVDAVCKLSTHPTYSLRP